MEHSCTEDYHGIRFHYARDEEPMPGAFFRHSHTQYEIVYTLCGAGSYVVEGELYELAPDTLMVFRPGEFHYVKVRTAQPYERYVIHVDADRFEAALSSVCNKWQGGALGGFYRGEALALSPLPILERFSALSALPHGAAGRLAELLLGELLLLLSHASPTRRTEERAEPLGARAVRYLNAHITEPLSLDTVAGEFYVSKYYLCRAFKRHNGISVMGYLAGKRVMLARRMIEEGEVASVAAERVGFSDYSTFYRAYRKAYGKPPKQARNAREGKRE